MQADLAGMSSAPHGATPTYSGRCRRAPPLTDASPNCGWRFRANEPSGRDDFLVGRGEGDAPERFVPSYHWACAIDDSDGGYSWVVRARDLAAAGPLQREVHAWLRPTVFPPSIVLTALVTADDGSRLEKRTAGVTLPELVLRLGSAASVARAIEDSASIEKLVADVRAARPAAIVAEAAATVRASAIV